MIEQKASGVIEVLGEKFGFHKKMRLSTQRQPHSIVPIISTLFNCS
jgi:hypothetical protein